MRVSSKTLCPLSLFLGSLPVAGCGVLADSSGPSSGAGEAGAAANCCCNGTAASTGSSSCGNASTTSTGSAGSGNDSAGSGWSNSGIGSAANGSSTSGNGSGAKTSVGTPDSSSAGIIGKGTTGASSGAVFVVPSDAAPTPVSSGTDGAFRVNATSGKLMHNGEEFQVRGGNWFGLEGQDDLASPGAMELYIGAVFWADASNKRSIETTMKEIQTSPLSFNTTRLPVAPQTLVPGHPDGNDSRTDVKIRNNDPTYYPYADASKALEDFIVRAEKNNLYLILDLHSCSNHIGWRAGWINDGPPWADSERENYTYKKDNYYCNQGDDAYDKEKWLADIHTLAKLPKKLGVKNIMGIDCFNEPFKYAWPEWADLAKECYDAIAAEDDDLIAVVEGVSSAHYDTQGNRFDEPFGDVATNPNWGENLYGQQFDPIRIPKVGQSIPNLVTLAGSIIMPTPYQTKPVGVSGKV